MSRSRWQAMGFIKATVVLFLPPQELIWFWYLDLLTSSNLISWQERRFWVHQFINIYSIVSIWWWRWRSPRWSQYESRRWCEVVMPLSINIRADNYGLSMLICGNRLHNKTRVTITHLYTRLLAAAIQIQEYGRGANKNRIETHK